MDRLLHRTRQLIFTRQNSIYSSTLIISGMLVVARLFGFMRYRILAGYFAKEELDIFFAAFRIPDLVFEILITGALTTTLIPFYIKYEKEKDKQTQFISSIVNIMLISLFILISLLAIFLHPVMKAITPGFDAHKTDQIVFLARFLLIGQLPFLVLGNFLTGISQANKMFLIPALAPLVYNIAIIITTILFANQIYLLAPILGVVIGAILFFIVQTPIIWSASFTYQPIIVFSKELWQFFRMIVPRMFTVVVAQIDATIDLALTSFLGAGSYTIFYLAQHLQLFPVSVFGMAFGQASLPYLTETYQEGNKEEFRRIVVDSILKLFFITIPIASFLIFARTPFVRLFYGGAKFDWDATNFTAITLSIFALSLPFHSIYYFLTRCFYAFFDSRTPFYISLVSIALNTIFSMYFILVLKLSVWWLAVSFSASMTINVLLLMIVLYKKIGGYPLHLLFLETFKIVMTTIISSTLVYVVMRLFDNPLVFDTSRTINVFLLLATVSSLYLILYLFLSWIFNVREIYLISKMSLKFKEYQKKILEIYTGVS